MSGEDYEALPPELRRMAESARVFQPIEVDALVARLARLEAVLSMIRAKVEAGGECPCCDYDEIPAKGHGPAGFESDGEAEIPCPFGALDALEET